MYVQRKRRCSRGGCQTRAGRCGVVAVEFVFVVTIAFVFLFTAFEFCRVAMIRHTVDNAVYEAARKGIIPGGTSAEAQQQARDILETVGVETAVVSITPPVIDRTTEDVTVSIRVPLDANSLMPMNFFRGKIVERTLTMRREGTR
ncbi:TadE-like protein [Roseimaritima multifibrata]|uniref:TadE-like protein n=1 Tax=Roseimaritima multifibrata TaxID=1930274 RepID=A0A517MAY3_9BACT|nr:TadE family protein [Roseimaritima multifibrata]QDS92011.1 TadE-like protein [Roseimaritima multifibrata]